MRDHEIEQVADLLRLLPPAPAGWVAAAQELPQQRAALDSLVARAEVDAAFRKALLDDLESAVAAAGAPPRAWLLDALRERLRSG
jgi:hypothetical protein